MRTASLSPVLSTDSAMMRSHESLGAVGSFRSDHIAGTRPFAFPEDAAVVAPRARARRDRHEGIPAPVHPGPGAAGGRPRHREWRLRRRLRAHGRGAGGQDHARRAGPLRRRRPGQHHRRPPAGRSRGLHLLGRSRPWAGRDPRRERHLPWLPALPGPAGLRVRAPRPAGEGARPGGGPRAPGHAHAGGVLRRLRRDLPVQALRSRERPPAALDRQASRVGRAGLVPAGLDAGARQGPRLLHRARPPRRRDRNPLVPPARAGRDPLGTRATVSTRYETAVPLGRGAVGEVYKAYDAQLGRFVALKFLRGDDPRLTERLMREARLQARVTHESVCQVYEVGADGGRPFIAMQYIEGETLEAVADAMPLLDRVRVLKDVAEAVHAAHETGLVHRDLKPQNIMVEARPDGGWRSEERRVG